MGYDDKIMLVKVHFSEGGIGYKHEHYHSQVTYVESGEFEFSIGDETKLVKGGDTVYIPPHVLHGAICKKEGILCGDSLKELSAFLQKPLPFKTGMIGSMLDQKD